MAPILITQAEKMSHPLNLDLIGCCPIVGESDMFEAATAP